jgi:cell division septum initiation protein DivIVA
MHDREILDSGSVSPGLQAFQKGELAVIIESGKTFSRMFMGYDPAAVDAYIEKLITKQQLLLDEVESLRARLKESGDEAAALRIEVTVLTDEVAVLTDTSPSPHAMQHRMAKMLRRAVDEVSEMQAEARAESEALIAAAEAKNEAAQRKYKELLADIAAQRRALEAEYEEPRKSKAPNWLRCALKPNRQSMRRGTTPNRSVSSSSLTQSGGLISIVSRPGGRWTRRVSNESRSWSN